MKQTKSSGNAFDWRGQPSIFTKKGADQRQSLAQVVRNATRVNREAHLCAFVPTERAAKLRKAAI